MRDPKGFVSEVLFTQNKYIMLMVFFSLHNYGYVVYYAMYAQCTLSITLTDLCDTCSSFPESQVQ